MGLSTYRILEYKSLTFEFLECSGSGFFEGLWVKPYEMAKKFNKWMFDIDEWISYSDEAENLGLLTDEELKKLIDKFLEELK